MTRYVITTSHAHWDRCRDDWLLNYAEFCEQCTSDRHTVTCVTHNIDLLKPFCDRWLLTYHTVDDQ